MPRRMRRMLHHTVHFVGDPRNAGRQTSVCAVHTINGGLRLQDIQFAGASESVRLAEAIAGNVRLLPRRSHPSSKRT